MTFDYFYCSQADSYSFYRIPRVLITGEHFKTLSTDAKLLYSLLLDRMGLSLKNKWLDDKGRVYIYYTIREQTDSALQRESIKTKTIERRTDLWK